MIRRALINLVSAAGIFILLMCAVLILLVFLEPSLFATWTF
jgi:hypothetical protein